MAPPPQIPTVQFDESWVTPEVEAEARTTLQEFPEVGEESHEGVYEAALTMIRRGGDQAALFKVLVDGAVPKARASEITRLVHFRTSSLIQRNRSLALGIVEAEWLYSGAPCMTNPKKPTPAEERQNAEHLAASGKRYRLAEGFPMGDRHVRPGEEAGCKCISLPIISWA